MAAVMIAISYGVSYLMQKDPAKQKTSPSDKIDVPTAEEGRPIAVLFGTKRIKGPNVVWYGDLKTRAIRK